MAFSTFSILTTLSLAFTIYKLISFIRFYNHARQTGFPVYVTPILSKSIPWMILGPTLQPQFQKYLPNFIYERLEIVTHGWEFRNKRKYHDKLGDTFVVVSPDEVSIWCAEPELANGILSRRIDFPPAPIVAKILGFFGPNVFCANGDEWKRHRRMFAMNLDERISRTVWTESIEQARAMREYILTHPGNETLNCLKSVAINVISRAGFSQKEPWAPNLRRHSGSTKQGKAAYFEALLLTTQFFMEAAMLPPRVLQMPFMPPGVRKLGFHMGRVSGYVKELLDEERQAAKQGGVAETRRSNFLTLMLQLSDEDRRSGQEGFSLSDEEISGNNGEYDGYAVTFLAAYPEWQDWFREELQGLDLESAGWKYEDVYSKCRRTLALMLETLRLLPPVLHTTRACLEPQILTGPRGDHLLTPPMEVYACQLSIHLNPKYWGPDASEFRPSRWIDESGDIITPPKGTYLPWSGGPRICPGLKMSEVEFVATMATLFRSARVDALATGGIERPEDVRRRLLELVNDSVSKLALQIRNPEGVQLKWTAV
ncbi:cytochrome P450 [Aspergillus karnatakaensis]|uniref:cytochrome P450 n=1 Tax=Aspergillus karnatakaensis TaxID=1810916 RepID=UPI003CCC968D